MTIEGTNLNLATLVLFNGQSTPFTVFGSSSIFTTVPSGASTGRIVVVTPAGSFISLTDFYVGAFVDLEVSAVTSANPVNPGENFTYTVTVTNKGLADAHDVTLSDLLPANAKVVSVFSTGGACLDLNQSVTCNFGSLAKGASAIVKIIVTPTGGPEISTTFHASTSDFEPSTQNNSASLTTTLTREGQLVIGIEAEPDKSATIFWPVSATGFLLEVTDSLAPPAFWKQVTDPIEVFGQQNTVNRKSSVGNEYFRLRKP